MARNRDVDSAEVAFRARAGGYAAIVGVIGAGIGIIFFAGNAYGILLGILSGAAVAAIVYFGSLGLAERGGRVAASVYHPAGASTPLPPQYSYAIRWLRAGTSVMRSPHTSGLRPSIPMIRSRGSARRVCCAITLPTTSRPQSRSRRCWRCPG